MEDLPMSEATLERPARPPLNGVDTPLLFATVDAVNKQRELAAFRFKATTTWRSGTHSRTSIKSFYETSEDREHLREFVLDADHPPVLVGNDNGPLPVELVLAGLGSCLTAGIGNIAAARGIVLHSVEAIIEGSLDIQGILGLSDQVRNGYDRIQVDFRIRGDAPPETLRQIVEQSKARSAVFDIVTHSVPVEIRVDAS